MLRLLVLQTSVFLFGSLVVATAWLDASGWASLPLALRILPLWLFYAALAGLILLLWDGISAAAFRLVTARWPTLFWRAVAPTLVLAAVGAALLSTDLPSFSAASVEKLAFALSAGLAATVVHAALALAVARKLHRLRGQSSDWSQHVATVEEHHGAGSMDRVRLSNALVLGMAPGDPRAAPPALVGLTSRPWHDARTLPWIRTLEASFEAIRAEALAVLEAEREPGPRALSGSGGGAGLREHHYPGVDAAGWDSFRFVAAGEEIVANGARCPRTLDALKQIPRFPLFVEAMYSVLGQSGRIAPHRDILNVWLTLHLPLVVPAGAGIRVGGIEREWREGEALLFDASYEHEAWGSNEGQRVVLLVDVLHPEVTDAEAELLEWFHWTPIP